MIAHTEKCTECIQFENLLDIWCWVELLCKQLNNLKKKWKSFSIPTNIILKFSLNEKLLRQWIKIYRTETEKAKLYFVSANLFVIWIKYNFI